MAGADADGFIELDKGSGVGGHLDTTEVTYLTAPVIRDRDRVVVAGDQAAELADVLNANPSSTTYGLVVREINVVALEKNNRSADWSETAEATNATATATRAAVAGQAHYVTGITGSFDIVPTGSKRLELREGAGGPRRLVAFLGELEGLAFTTPILFPVNTAAVLTLAAGGIGTIGAVSLIGYTA